MVRMFEPTVESNQPPAFIFVELANPFNDRVEEKG